MDDLTDLIAATLREDGAPVGVDQLAALLTSVVEQHTNGRIAELEERIAELEQKGSWEYEYGVVAEAFGGDPEASPTLEAALHVRDNATTIYKAWTKGEPVTIVCRRPFGPWMPAALEGEQQ